MIKAPLYPEHVIPDGSPAATAWNYLNGQRSATKALSKGQLSFPTESLPPGKYKAWWLADGGYKPITKAIAFTILPAVVAEAKGPTEWPTHRHDFSRSGFAPR